MIRDALCPVIACYPRPETEARPIQITVLGVHHVQEAPDPCHLIELRLDSDAPGERLALRTITQEAAGEPGRGWPKPFDEHLLDSPGESGRPLEFWEAAALPAPARIAFFFHYLRPGRPLLTPAGPVRLPPPTTRPDRLRFLTYV